MKDIYTKQRKKDLRKRQASIKSKKLKEKYLPIIIMTSILILTFLVLEYIDKKLENRLQEIAIHTAHAEELDEPAPEYEVIIAEVSAYTSSVDETDDTPFITASGQRTRDGIIACPSRFDFGQIIEIKGKDYECQDRMNKRYRDKNNFDIWVVTKSEAFAWGRRTLEVKIK